MYMYIMSLYVVLLGTKILRHVHVHYNNSCSRSLSSRYRGQEYDPCSLHLPFIPFAVLLWIGMTSHEFDDLSSDQDVLIVGKDDYLLCTLRRKRILSAIQVHA